MFFQPSASEPVSQAERVTVEVSDGNRVASMEGERWPSWAGGGLLTSLQRLASQAGQSACNPTIPAEEAGCPGFESTASEPVPNIASAQPVVKLFFQCQ